MDILQIQEKHIFKHLQPIFYSHGYENTPDKQQFRKQDVKGFKNVRFSINSKGEGQLINIHLGLRNNKLEALVEQFLPETSRSLPNNLPNNEKQTIEISLSRFYPQKQGGFLLQGERSLQQSCREVASFMKKKGFRFLEGMSKLHRIDATLNRRPGLPSPYMRNQLHRCFRGIALASILHRRDFEELVSVYSAYLYSQCAPPAVSHSFERLVNYLRYFSFN